MTPREILNFAKAEPFRPFRLHMVSRRTFDIRHPEMVRVGTRDMIIFTFVGETPEDYDQWDAVSPMLVESVSHLETSVA
jgi:hypothetical protein